MKLVSFYVHDEVRLGIETDMGILDAHCAYRAMLEQQGEPIAGRLAEALVPKDAVAFLEGGERSLNEARKLVAYAAQSKAVQRHVYDPVAVRLAPPVPRPGKIVCVGRNYHDHVSEMKREVPTIPVIFAKLPNTVCGPEDSVPFPRVSDQLDYEAELAVVIGKRGRYIDEADAMGYIAGYTALNDITVRDWQHRTPQWLQGKSFDKSAPIGPRLVLTDEISDPHTLGIKLWLNDELRQNDNTGRLIFNVPKLVSFISQVMTLEPGDVIATGTPGGVGVAMDPKGFMKVGDTVRVELEQIGTLTNYIVED
ncbi:fumarylacetoacetate hydrolase family protein [Alicyclobacillus sp. ALC3]|uniref:fumarylacetoacetate hydrolase family protein n=1 Tax=Alicyclobacillus sp. ALC3 TaxID=2796143 RepID=UPI00237935ED|nr:fumarylacetoacetate hydrolase family protein [Alicyclobacillus sp. ALC3]WDL95741.1 fumarylacetoacetate hydrolase family protein [Alicyclobacillus sp. ALC3]